MRAYLLSLFRQPRPKVEPTAREALTEIRALIEARNIEVIADDFDGGYDMALDEVLDIIDDYMRTRFPHPRKGS